LNKIWKIVQNLITRKYPSAFEFAVLYTQQLTTIELQQLLNQLIEKTKTDIFNLVSNAYSSININELANTLGLSNEETVRIALTQNWHVDETQIYLIPDKKRNIIFFPSFLLIEYFPF
jgi:hypothetical protein